MARYYQQVRAKTATNGKNARKTGSQTVRRTSLLVF